MTSRKHNKPVVGSRLGVDVGRARVGLAATDPAGILATPISTLKRDLHNYADLQQIVDEANERNAVRVYLGNPINLQGKLTASTQDAHDYAEQLATLLTAHGSKAEVRLIDERLSTVSASQKLHEVGINTKKQRSIIDQMAAVAILEQAMFLEAHTGINTGTLVQPSLESDDD